MTLLKGRWNLLTGPLNLIEGRENLNEDQWVLSDPSERDMILPERIATRPERVTRHGGGLLMVPGCLSIHPAALDGLDLDSIVCAKDETADKGGSSPDSS